MKTTNTILKNKREIDENGFLTAYDCLLLHDGIMEYRGYELIEGCNTDNIDGVNIEHDKIYKLNISKEELIKSKDTFKLIPVVNGHTFLGKEGENAKDYQEGCIGENIEVVEVKDDDGIIKNFLKATIKFTNPETVKLIETGEKEELSTSYSNDLIKSKNENYDFEVINITANHVALVDKGRAGSKVKVSNNLKRELKMRKKIINEEVSLKEATEVLEEETKYHKEHPVSEKSEKEENNKAGLINEITEILKNKIDPVLLEEIITKIKNLMPEEQEESIDSSNESTDEEQINNEDEVCDNNEIDRCESSVAEQSIDEKKDICNNSDLIYQEIKTKLENENRNILKAFNEVRPLTGDFNFFGMTEKDIYIKAFKDTDIDIKGDETVKELKAMFRVYNCCKKQMYNNNQINIETKTTINVPDCYK